MSCRCDARRVPTINFDRNKIWSMSTELGRKANEVSVRLDKCPVETPETPENDTYSKQLAEIDRKADRLIDAFAESTDMPPAYLQRSLARLEQERQSVLEAQRRERKRPAILSVLDFPSLGFEEKKAVAAQFIRRVEVSEDSAEIIWNV